MKSNNAGLAADLALHLNRGDSDGVAVNRGTQHGRKRTIGSESRTVGILSLVGALSTANGSGSEEDVVSDTSGSSELREELVLISDGDLSGSINHDGLHSLILGSVPETELDGMGLEGIRDNLVFLIKMRDNRHHGGGREDTGTRKHVEGVNTSLVAHKAGLNDEEIGVVGDADLVVLISGDEAGLAVDLNEIQAGDGVGLRIQEVSLNRLTRHKELELNGIDITEAIAENDEAGIRGHLDVGSLARGRDISNKLRILNRIHEDEVTIGSSDDILGIRGEGDRTNNDAGHLVLSLLAGTLNTFLYKLLSNSGGDVLMLRGLGSGGDILRNIEGCEVLCARVVDVKCGSSRIGVVDRGDSKKPSRRRREHLSVEVCK
jgi:hypothetical protein